ncbi:hypothetical protein D5085_13790 [Ectothiorhodospiraceae bacterium BW-2]|nr:hypothetical protein D5085_13790 [Ectothiorhodospiraceae bacterium BW-2]
MTGSEIKKLLQRHFVAQVPFVLTESEAQRNYLEQLAEEIRQRYADHDVEIGVHQNSFYPDRGTSHYLLRLNFSCPDASYYSLYQRKLKHYGYGYYGHKQVAEVNIQFFLPSDRSNNVDLAPGELYLKLNSLMLRWSADRQPLWLCLDKIYEKLEQQQGAVQKQEKVMQLQLQAIEGKVEQLARRYRLYHNFKVMSKKIRIALATEDISGYIEFDIKWSEFQQAMRKIEQVFDAFFSLHQLKVVNQIRFNKVSVKHLVNTLSPPPEPEPNAEQIGAIDD